jgi:hypothetical protein
LVFPGELGSHYLRGAVHTLRLVSGSRVRTFLASVQPVVVEAPRAYPFQTALIVTARLLSQRYQLLRWPQDMDVYLLSQGGPYSEGAAVVFTVFH